MLGGMSGEMLRRKDSRTNTLFGFSGRGTLDWLNKKITEGMCSPAGELNFFRIKNNNEKLSRTLHHIIYFCAHIPSLFFPSPKDFCTNLYTCSAMPPREEARLRRSARQAAAAAAANGQSEANPLPQRSPVLVEETPTTTPSIPGTPPPTAATCRTCCCSASSTGRCCTLSSNHLDSNYRRSILKRYRSTTRSSNCPSSTGNCSNCYTCCSIVK